MTTPHSPMFVRSRHALVAGVLLLAAGAVIAVVVGADPAHPAVQPVDDRWASWVDDVRSAPLTRTAELLSFFGGPLVVVPLRVFVVGVLTWRRRWLHLGAFLGATVMSELSIGPLKAIIDRPRPPDPMIETTSSSFPSGHAIAAAVTAIGLVIVFAAPAGRNRWTAAAAGFAAAMALSRTYLSAHWLSDVIGGACLGTGWAVVWPAALELRRARRLERRTVARPAGTPAEVATTTD